MKAIIMAGGEGSRLRPLTCDTPKPMTRLLGRPVLEYILDLLLENGCSEATLTLGYLAQEVERHFPQGQYRGLRLRFVEEHTPLGTAGGVKNASDPGDDNLLVISGDALCDFDLASAMERHRAGGQDATILCKRVSDPREYGLVRTDSTGAVVGFLEKPAYTQVVTDLANTGIYILSRAALDLIPDETPFDFAKDLFPRMLRNRMPIQAVIDDGYWCDIGDMESYRTCQRDMLTGKVHCHIKGTRDPHGNIFAGEAPTGNLHIVPPVYIGEHVVLESGATLESSTVIDDGCHIGSCRITGSIVLPGTMVAGGCKVTGAVLCPGSTLKERAMVFEGAAVGSGAVVGEKTAVKPGVKIWPGKQVPDGTIVSAHVKYGMGDTLFFDRDGVRGSVGVEISPELCARFGAALSAVDGVSAVAVASSGQGSPEALARALISGIQSVGLTALDFGSVFAAQFQHQVQAHGADLGVYLDGTETTTLSLLAADSLPAPRGVERTIEGAMARGEFLRRSGSAFGSYAHMGDSPLLYLRAILDFAKVHLDNLPRDIALQPKSISPKVESFAREVLSQLGFDTDSGVTLYLSRDGTALSLFDPALGYLGADKVQILCCMEALQKEREVAVPFDAPRILDKLAAHSGGVLHRYYSCPADGQDQHARALAARQRWTRDGIFQSILVAAALLRHRSLAQVFENLSYSRVTRLLSTEVSPAGILRHLSGETPDIQEGILIQNDLGIALIQPNKRGNALKVLAEASRVEIAEELCAGLIDKIKERSEQIQSQNNSSPHHNH